MGNALNKEHDISPQPCASGGPKMMWKIFPATNKTTKQEVSFFIVKISDLEHAYGKTTAPVIIDTIRHEAGILSKLKHPSILGVVSPLIETGKEIALVTEPVFGSLANILFDYTNIVTSDKHPKPCVPDYELHPVESQYGLCQISEALSFLHYQANCVHCNVSPSTIFVTKSGDWKLGGFNFTYFENLKDSKKTFFVGKSLSKSFVPDLDFSAPEYVLNKSPGYTSDVFSIGCLYVQLISGKQILNANDNLETYQKQIQYLPSLTLDDFSPTLQKSLKDCLEMSQDQRIDSQRLLASHLFSDIQIRSLRYLAELEIKETVKKAQFLKNLPNIIDEFPIRILFKKVLPPILRELNNPKITSFALPNVLAISEKMEPDLFIRGVLPTLSKCFTYDEPPNIPLTLLKAFNVLLSKTTQLEHKNCKQKQHVTLLDLIPFLLRCLDSSYPDVEIEVLKKAEESVSSKLIGYLQFKTHLLPKIDALCRRTPYSSVRVNCVVCLGRVSSILDKDSLIGVVVPLLDYCLQVDDSPTLLMSVVGVYSRVSKQCDSTYIAQKILPSLLPIAMSKSFNHDQFTKYMKTVKGLLEVIEGERMHVFRQEEELRQATANQQPEEDMDEILQEEFKKKQMMKQMEEEKRQQPPVQPQKLEPKPIKEEKPISPQVKEEKIPSGFEVSDDEEDGFDAPIAPVVAGPNLDSLLTKFETPDSAKRTDVTPTQFDSVPFGANDTKPIVNPTNDSNGFDDLLKKQTSFTPIYNQPSTEKKFENVYSTPEKKKEEPKNDPFGSLANDPAFQNMKPKPKPKVESKPLPKVEKVETKPLPEIPKNDTNGFGGTVGGFGGLGFDDDMDAFGGIKPTTTTTTTTTTLPSLDDTFGGGMTTKSSFDFDDDEPMFKPTVTKIAEPKKSGTGLGSIDTLMKQSAFDDDDDLGWSKPQTTSTSGTTDLDSLMGNFSSDPFDF